MSETLLQGPNHPYRVGFDGRFQIAEAPTEPPASGQKNQRELRLKDAAETIGERQKVLHADGRYALLLVFQAMDAAGKDSTIREVLSGVNPAGCIVHASRPPSEEERDHDFLWRHVPWLPRRGDIGVFNRSYYEEVLVVRVNPQLLDGQKLHPVPVDETFWARRLESIADHERHLARSGTVILKFWLNVSREEQRQRLLSRLDEPEKHWKFEAQDLDVREHWDRYMEAYEEAIRATSKPWAPWYAIPADSKPYMRMTVAEIIASALEGLPLRYPALEADEVHRLDELRERLKASG